MPKPLLNDRMKAAIFKHAAEEKIIKPDVLLLML
jgi:hypothetical protein